MTSSIAGIGKLPLYIDSTMIVAFRQCPKKFYYEHIECLRPSGRSRDLVAGAAFAAASEAVRIEYFSGSHNMQRALEAGYLAHCLSWGDFPDEDTNDDDKKRNPKSFSRTFQAVVDYFERYHPDIDPVKPFLRHDGRPSFEFSFGVPLSGPNFPFHPSGEPFIYCGRFDTFGHLDGRLVIEDDKTSGKAPSKWWARQFDLRNQFILYTWGATQCGFPTDTVVVRGITIQKTQFHHIEAIKVYSDVLVSRAVSQLARDLHRLVDCFNSGYFDFDLGDSCNAFGRPCAFMDPCSAPDPSMWFTDYSRERWSPADRQSIPLTVEKEAA